MRKGLKKLTDDQRATQIAMFQDPETIKGIAKFQAARVKMTDEEKSEEVDDAHKRLGMLPKRRKPKGPYEVDTTKEADMTEQAAAPAPEYTIEIGDNNNNNNEWAQGQDEGNDNTLHPWTARKQGCENDPEEKPLFSNESDNDHDDNNPNDDYSQSSNDENKNKKSKRKTPTSTIRTPGENHFSGRTSPAAQEEANVLVAIGTKPSVAKFMVMDGLDEITEIQ